MDNIELERIIAIKALGDIGEMISDLISLYESREIQEENRSIHKLKTDPGPFTDMWDQKKKFEMRINDRNFQVGDVLVLEETRFTGQEMETGKQLEYTGRVIYALIEYFMTGPAYGLTDGWLLMGIKEIYRTSQRCRVCGCTDIDCRRCFELQGSPCYWIEDDLCSRCARIMEENREVCL
jgi:hypothetical protein